MSAAPDDDSAEDWRGPEARGDARVELAGVRTGLALERTRMSSDRTLMAIMRTALSMIGFGIAMFEFVDYLRNQLGLRDALYQAAGRNVGIGLTALGIGVLALGFVSHFVFLRRLAAQRSGLQGRGLVPAALDLPGSLILTLAFLLLVGGIAAILRMAWRVGLLG
jgi:putative membrane protein